MNTKTEKQRGKGGKIRKWQILAGITAALVVVAVIVFCLASNYTREEQSDNVQGGTKTEFEFNKTKWRTKVGRDYPYRNEMLEDLINNQKLKGLKRDEVIDMLGEPDRSDGSYLFYMVTQKRILFYPLHTKSLVIKLSKDNTVEWRKIHE